MALITVYEVGPRDGLQNEAAVIDTAHKVAFINSLSDSGLGAIEVSAFVNPKRIPQMADADDVCAQFRRKPGTRYSALVPNLAGLDRAVAVGLEEVAVFAATSDTFSQRNINQTVDESMTRYAEVVRAANEHGLRVRGYLSTAFGCPFEGDVPVDRVVRRTQQLLDMGVFEVAVSDTIGIAHPGQVRQVLGALTKSIAPSAIALHFHDTRGTALANVLASLEFEIRTFDSSAGGLGGCPYAPGATGNLATEDLLYLLHGLGHETGVSLERVIAGSETIEPVVGHPLPSRLYRATLASRKR